MRRKFFSACALVALSAVPAMLLADEVMIVNPAEGLPVVTQLEEVAKITFGPESITIVSPSGSVEIAYSAVQSIKFDLEHIPSGIQVLNSDAKLKVSYADSRLLISGAKGATDVAVFGINGKLMLNDPAFDGSSFDVSSLGSGVYIAKINNMVVKFVKKQ